MHKKILTIFLLLSLVIVTWCSGVGSESSQTWPKDWNVKVYRCDLPINECTRDMWKTALRWEWTVLVDENLQWKNSLFGLASGNVITSILSLDKLLNSSSENMFVDTRKNIISITEPTNQRCINKNTYDITLDLTYHDFHSKNKGAVEDHLKALRIKKLRDYLEWADNPKTKLQDWDVINLRFLWTIEFQGTSSPLMDKITLHYMSKCEDTDTTFELLHDTIEHNAKHSEIRLFYWLKQLESDKNADTVGWAYTSIDSIMKKVEDEFNQRYGKYSEGTFLLNHLVNNSILTQYKKNQRTILFFDWLFQLSPSDKETFVKRFGKFPASTYEFNVNNIKKYYKDWFFFKNFFIDNIFKELPVLNTLCPVGNEGKLDLYIIWMNVVNDLTVQNLMKDFYTNHLFKNCNVFYQ